MNGSRGLRRVVLPLLIMSVLCYLLLHIHVFKSFLTLPHYASNISSDEGNGTRGVEVLLL